MARMKQEKKDAREHARQKGKELKKVSRQIATAKKVIRKVGDANVIMAALREHAAQKETHASRMKGVPTWLLTADDSSFIDSS